MRMITPLLLAASLILGCQARPKVAHVAAAPKSIEALTNQTIVYTCPQCGMDYDAPGKCSMCDVDLVKTRVSYICPVDNKPVDHAGPCPRCNANARVVKTAVAADAPAPGAAPSGGGADSKAPGAAGTGATNGS